MVFFAFKELWFVLVAQIGREFALERALCEAGAPGFCPTEVREKRATGHAKRIERRTMHPQMPPYVLVKGFNGFPWEIMDDREVLRNLVGYLGSEEGETYIPMAVPWTDVEQLMRQGYNLPADKQIIRVGNRRLKKEARKLRRLLAA